MADREDLDKLFDAALHGRKAPSRFGTPEEQVKAAPAVFMKSSGGAQNADGTSANPFVAAPADGTASDDASVLDEKSQAALDEDVNAEFQEIINKKIAKERAKRRRDRMFFYFVLIGATAGGGFWFFSKPERMESAKKIVGEIRLAMDPTAVADKYDKSLEKVAERGDQLGEAAGMIGGKDVEGDNSLDEAMKKIAGEDAGLSPSEREKKLKEKFDSLNNKKPE